MLEVLSDFFCLVRILEESCVKKIEYSQRLNWNTLESKPQTGLKRKQLTYCLPANLFEVSQYNHFFESIQRPYSTQN